MLKEWMCELAHVLFDAIAIRYTAYEELREYGVGLAIELCLCWC